MTLLHLGCGSVAGDHWLNVDSSPNVWLAQHPSLLRWLRPLLPESSRHNSFRNARYLELRRPWRIDDGSVDAIYASHVFEHLTFSDGQHVLAEGFRVLKPGGVLRFVLPDFAREVEKYLHASRNGERLAATKFADDSHVFDPPPAGPAWYRLFFRWYNKNTHKMFYDEASLTYYLETHGFERIARCAYLESHVPHLEEVECEERVSESLCLEARKPERNVSA